MGLQWPMRGLATVTIPRSARTMALVSGSMMRVSSVVTAVMEASTVVAWVDATRASL